MIGSVAADPLMTGVDRGNKSFIAAVTDLPLLSSLLVHSWAAFGAIKGDVCSALRYLIKARLFYFCTILLMLIAAPTEEYANGSVVSYRDIFRNNKTATVTQVVDQELCWFQTRLFHTRIDNQVNTTIFTAPAQKGQITFSYNIACEVQEEEMAS